MSVTLILAPAGIVNPLVKLIFLSIVNVKLPAIIAPGPLMEKELVLAVKIFMTPTPVSPSRIFVTVPPAMFKIVFASKVPNVLPQRKLFAAEILFIRNVGLLPEIADFGKSTDVPSRSSTLLLLCT